MFSCLHVLGGRGVTGQSCRGTSGSDVSLPSRKPMGHVRTPDPGLFPPGVLRSRTLCHGQYSRAKVIPKPSPVSARSVLDAAGCLGYDACSSKGLEVMISDRSAEAAAMA